MKKVEKQGIEDILALTPLQEGMLFHYMEAPESESYVEQLCLELSGNVERGIFEKAWMIVTRKHQMLRAFFRWEGMEKPVQVIKKKHVPKIKFYDLTKKKETEKKGSLEKITRDDREEAFQLEDVPFRVSLITQGNDKYRMIITNHHIIYDGWSGGIVLKDFFKTTAELSKGKEPPMELQTVTPKFKEYIHYMKAQAKESRQDYWREYLEGVESQLPMPIERKPGQKKGDRQHTSESIEVPIKMELEETAVVLNVTPAIILYTAWGLLLQRYKNSSDTVLGVTVSGRNAKIKQIENIVGLFINTIPLRIKTEPELKTSEMLRKVRNQRREVEDYEHTPLVEIMKYSGLKNPDTLFDTIMVIENYPLEEILAEVSEGAPVKVDSYTAIEATNYSLAAAVEIREKLKLRVSYSRELFGKDSIRSLIRHYEVLLNDILKNPGKRISKLEILTEEEKKQLLDGFNATTVDNSTNQTIHRLIEQKAITKGAHDRTAVIESNTQISYNCLEQEAERIAVRLKREGVKVGTIVAILIEPSIEMIIGILGILKAGAAILPIATGTPHGRIRYMLADSNAKLLLTNRNNKELDIGKCSQLSIRIEENKDENLQKQTVEVQSTDPVYLIYTSGTTGKPKGVLVEHRSLVNLCAWHNRYIEVRASDRAAKYAGFGFDATVWEIFPYLVAAASLLQVPEDIKLDIEKLNEYYEKHDVTIAFLPTQMCEQFQMQKNRSLRVLLTGGDKLNRYYGTKYRLINNYGPTENTVVTTSYCVGQQSHNIPIGKPVDNTRVIIMDKNGRMQPVGVPGELCIRGCGLARGYLNQPELTAEKFDRRPGQSGERMYRTGDIANWLQDGNIQFLGRLDNQVQVRGYRIELGEVESCLLKIDGIKEAVVVAGENDDNPEKTLTAYYIAKENVRYTAAKLKQLLATHLPHYMIPESITEIEKIPVTQNGKVDRKALEMRRPLPETNRNGREKDDGLPRDDVERKLLDIWSTILGKSKEYIGIDENFFELGGHSLKATRMTSKINKTFNKKTSVTEIFNAPTIRQLSQIIRGAEIETYQTIEAVEAKEYYPLSSAQQRLCVQQQIDDTEMAYNMPMQIEVQGPLDKNRLEESLRKLIRRHESLRTSFPVIEGKQVQRIHREVGFSIEINTVQGEVDNWVEQFVRPFDLSQAPLLRVVLLEQSKSEHILLVDMHHIITDGASMAIIEKELAEMYNGKSLEPLRIQYKDYSEWQNSPKGKETAKKNQRYWREQYAQKRRPQNMPLDNPRNPESLISECGVVYFEADKTLTEGLRRTATRSEATLYMVLLAAYNILLSKYTGRDDVVVGTPVAARTHADLDNIIGMFINILAMRNYPEGKKSFEIFIEEVKENTLKAFDNQDYPFELLTRELHMEREPGRNLLVDTTFVMQNTERTGIELGNLKFQQKPIQSRTAKFDLVLEAEEQDQRIAFMLQYATALFKKESIETICQRYVQVLEALVENNKIKLMDIELLDEPHAEEVDTQTTSAEDKFEFDF